MGRPTPKDRDGGELEAWLARPRVEVALVLGIAALAFGLRVVHVLQSQASPLFEQPQMDALYHVEWARAFARGERFQTGPFFRAPLYPWFLGTVFRLFGDGLLLPRLIQAGFGAATAGLTYGIARMAFHRRAALLAGLFAATYWVSIFYDGELLLESLATPLYAAGILLTLPLARRRSAGRGAAAGLVWGLSAITRPNVLLFLPLCALWIAWRGRTAGRPWAPALAFCAGVLAPILPITAFNAVAGGDLVLVASQGGVNFWIGNNPRSDGSTAIVPGTREDWWGGYRDAIALAERAEGRELLPSEVSRHYTRKALAFLRAEPGQWLGLMAWKLRLFWTDWELGNNEEPRFLAQQFSPLLRFLPLGFGLLAPLGLVGLALALARGRAAWLHFPLWGFLLAYTASVVLFFVNARFRLPVLPPLMVYAAWCVTRLWDAARARRFLLLAAAAAALLLLGLAVQRVPASILKAARSNGPLVLANAELRARNPERAASWFHRAILAEPGNWIAHRGLGAAYRELGRPKEAEASYREALRLRPDDALALEGLTDLYLSQGRLERATATAERAIRAAPQAASGHYDLGRARYAAGDLEGAARSFREARDRDPRHFGAAYSLGVALAALGRNDGAIEALGAALQAPEPPDEAFLVDAHRRLIALLEGSGHRARALGIARRMAARFPSDPFAREALARLSDGG